MKERGMIFNGEMVRAILSGRKTQTRRPILWRQTPYTEVAMANDGMPWPWSEDCERGGDIWHHCPFGNVGDRIWVRETWGVMSYEFDDLGLMVDYIPDRPAKAIHEMPFGSGHYSGHVIYAADGDATWCDDDGWEDGRSRWKPSTHMPRWASRITLEITGVRVERLHDISDEDAEAEGVDPETLSYRSPSCGFLDLWESLYGVDNRKSNPWVWVIEFKVVSDE
ncbi:hypothetical protein [Lonsdalea quercina]|uniref:hypothetical protein n=1 Tax=Lonsdalea quercina TaxID=71657 RepID=UPI003975C5E8